MDLYFRVLGKARHHIKWMKDEASASAWIAAEQGVSPTGGITWKDCAALWLAAHPTAVPNYRRQVERACIGVYDYLRDVVGIATPAIESTTLLDFSNWVKARAKTVAGRTANKDMGNARAAAIWARGTGLVSSLPFEHALTVEEKSQHERKPFGHELSKYLEALPLYLRLPAEFLALTGWRSGAMCSLTKEGVDSQWCRSTSKRGRAVSAPIDDALRSVIDRANGEWPGAGPVFRNSRGRAWTPATFGRAWREKLEESGLAHRVPHELRHTFGTAAGGMFSPDQIKAGMGHASRASSEVYVQTQRDQALADQVQLATRKIVAGLLHGDQEQGNNPADGGQMAQIIICPHCGGKFISGNADAAESRG